MNEPRDSPARRKQFLVISAIMVVMSLHAALTAGMLATITIAPGQFPGGEFVYKFMTKDYAASTGTLRTVSSDLGITEDGGSSNLIIAEEEEGFEKLDTADLLYSILLDDPSFIPGGNTRFASGVLLPKESNSNGGKMKKLLLEDANTLIAKEGKEIGTHSKDVKYEVGKLPKVNAAVAQHPFTAGAFSAILQSYKIVPKFKQYAKDHGESGKSPIIIATCSAKQKMCTYYMPLAKRDAFYMGKPTMEQYASTFDNASMLERIGIESFKGINFGNVGRGIKRMLGMGGGSSSKEEKKDEL